MGGHLFRSIFFLKNRRGRDTMMFLLRCTMGSVFLVHFGLAMKPEVPSSAPTCRKGPSVPDEDAKRYEDAQQRQYQRRLHEVSRYRALAAERESRDAEERAARTLCTELKEAHKSLKVAVQSY